MPRRRSGQLGWADAAVTQTQGRRRDRLGEIDGLVGWQPFDRRLAGIHAAPRGQASYPPLMMLKMLLLQRWHDLPGPAMEEALADRLSFWRFVGLSLGDQTPDHATNLALSRGAGETAARGWPGGWSRAACSSSRGAHRRHARQERRAVPQRGEGPVSPVDPDARFGTKLHVASDAGSALVRAVRTTPANVQEIVEARPWFRAMR